MLDKIGENTPSSNTGFLGTTATGSKKAPLEIDKKIQESSRNLISNTEEISPKPPGCLKSRRWQWFTTFLRSIRSFFSCVFPFFGKHHMVVNNPRQTDALHKDPLIPQTTIQGDTEQQEPLEKPVATGLSSGKPTVQRAASFISPRSLVEQNVPDVVSDDKAIELISVKGLALIGWLEHSDVLQNIEETAKQLAKFFNKEETEQICMWLGRLKETDDFEGTLEEMQEIEEGNTATSIIVKERQETLSQAASNILCLMATNESFKNTALTSIYANNECCSDRAAMTINELYTAWVISSLSDCGASIQEKLKTVIGCAKTFALRAYLAEKIVEYDKKITETEQPNPYDPNWVGSQYHYRESVQLYLSYEQMLKEQLGLVSLMLKSGGSTKKKIVGEPGEIVKAVNNRWIDHLMNLPIFSEMINKNADFTSMWSPIEDEFYERLETLEINATPEHRESLDIQHEQGKVMLELQQRKKEVVQAWLAEQKLP